MLEEINVHREERSKALRAVEEILTEAGRYPFSTGNMGGKIMILIMPRAFTSCLDTFDYLV